MMSWSMSNVSEIANSGSMIEVENRAMKVDSTATRKKTKIEIERKKTRP